MIRKQDKLSSAFDLLKVWQDGCYVITKESWHKLLKISDEKLTQTQRELMLNVLDTNGVGSIGMCIDVILSIWVTQL